MFDYYKVEPDKAASLYGPMLQLFGGDSDDPVQTMRVPAFGNVPAQTAYPVRARWSALLYLPGGTPISLSVQGGAADVQLDGQPALPGGALQVQPGWHQVTMDATLQGPTGLSLLLKED